MLKLFKIAVENAIANRTLA